MAGCVMHALLPALGGQRLVDLWVQDQLGLHCRLQVSRGYFVKPYLKKKNQKKFFWSSLTRLIFLLKSNSFGNKPKTWRITYFSSTHVYPDLLTLNVGRNQPHFASVTQNYELQGYEIMNVNKFLRLSLSLGLMRISENRTEMEEWNSKNRRSLQQSVSCW